MFPGDSEMARRVRAFDWSTTPVGPVSRWPRSLRTVVRVMLDSRYAMWLGWGPDFTFFYNDAYAAMSLGPKHAWALGRSAREVWSEIWTDIGPRAESVMRTGQATWDEGLQLFLERRGFREETYHSFSYSPIPDDGGDVGGMLCVVTEDTERTIGERRVRTLQEVGAQTMSAARSPERACEIAAELCAANPFDLPFLLLYLLDEDGRTKLVGSSGLMAGGPASPAVVALNAPTPAWPFREAAQRARPVDVDDLEARFGPLVAGPWSEPLRCALVLPMHRPGQASIAGFMVAGVSPRLEFTDAYRGFVSLLAGQCATAIASAEAYEAERRRAATLEELDRAKTAFFSNVSHEFRTPLTLLLGPLDDVRHSSALSAHDRSSIDVAHRNGLRLLRLVNTLLDFSRIEAGRAEANFEPLDVGAFTADLASVFRSATDRAGLTLTVECPPLRQPVFVDREMWEKIVLNLVSNAFKFTHRGGITVAVEEHDGAATLEVRDTGVGIPADEVPHVFERFHRVRSTEGRSHEGTGIGLALVVELVRLHGGSVTVQSEVGRGSTFRVTIPTGSGHLPSDRLAAPRSLPSTSVGAAAFVDEALRWDSRAPADEDNLPTPGSGRAVGSPDAKILLADDNADMRAYVSRLLRPHWRVDEVGDGEAALRAIRADKPDLVLSDVMMPRLDGLGLVREIRADPALRTLPVILVSARAGEESRLEGLQTGADDYLVKPFSARELVVRVNAHLEMARVRAEVAAERERTAAVLLKEENRYRALVEATSAIVWTADADGAVTIASEWPEAMGPTPERFHGEAWRDTIHPEDRDRVFDTWARAMREQSAVSAEHRIRVGDGTYRWMSVTAVPLVAADGGIESWVGTVSDIDARRSAEEALRARTAELQTVLDTAERARADAEEANRAKDEFLAVLSHELRSPMNAMLGWLQVLKKAGARDPALLSRAVETLERNIWNQAQVINDLLDVSRIMAGKLQLEREWVDLGDVATNVVESLRPAAESKRVALRLALEANALEVSGDSGRLRQVVSNLVGNAIKFTKAGGLVAVTVDHRDGAGTITVQDDGEGIDPGFLPRLFERFQQADSSATRQHGGLGLGLAIVKNLVVLHGGSIAAESDGPGRGARFTVTLPLTDGQQRLLLAGSRSPVDRPAGPLPALDVLVVEDDADSRHALELMLAEIGTRVRTAESVRTAIEAYDARPPDVLISDIGMPGEDGYVLIRRIRRRERGRAHRTMAIAMTGFASLQDRESALRAGYDDHVPKPVQLDVLCERMRVLEASRTVLRRAGA
jgi:PAS domain S-box-containing protein